MNKIKKYIPMNCYKTVYDVDFNSLYSQGKRFILFDLDNTLAPYDEVIMSDRVKAFLDKLKEIGFTVAIVSNNNTKRVKKYLNGYDMLYIARSLKPYLRGYKIMNKMLGNPPKNEVLTVGDQLLTDVAGSNTYGYDVILVESIKRKNEKWYTKINRKRSKYILKEIKKFDEEMYHKIKVIDEVKNG